MAKLTSTQAVTFIVALGIAAPAVAGQAVPRTSGTSGTATSSGSSSGGGSSSSGGGSSSSSGSGGASAPVGASGQSMFGGEFRSAPSRIASGNNSRTGTAAARPAPAPGGVSSGGSDSSSSSRIGDLADGFSGGNASARTRNGQPIVGSAAVRPFNQGNPELVSFPFYGPWGLWYPWYGGFGWNTGYVTYNPWMYGATRWYWSPYGMWYDPYSYWDPFYGSRDSGYARERAPRVEKTTGEIRIKANPDTAKVYIDNALVGTVDEFNGLNDGLEVEKGRHVIELRAEGYVTKSEEITVKAGTKLTVRINLKEKK